MNPRQNLISTIAITLMEDLELTREARTDLAEKILDNLRMEMSLCHGDLLVQEWSNLMEEFMPETNPPYNVKIITGYSQLTEDDLSSLREQGVCLDDWDYMIFVEHCKFYQTGHEIHPEDYQLDRLLGGCCGNTWYQLIFRGETGIMGVAYHG